MPSGSEHAVAFFGEDLIRRCGHAALHQLHFAEGERIKRQTVEACGGGIAFGIIADGGEHIRDIVRHDGANALRRFHSGDVSFIEAPRGLHVDVHHVVIVVIFVDGAAHVRCGGQQAGKKSHAQRRDGKDGDEAAEGALHRAQDVFCVRFFHRITTRSRRQVSDAR